MLEAALLSGARNHGEHVSVKKFRHNDKASYEVLVRAALDEGEMNEFINNLIAMRDGK